MRHKHADLIHAWAEGAKIQVKELMNNGEWTDANWPRFDHDKQYRIKPKAVKKWQWAYKNECDRTWRISSHCNELSFDNIVDQAVKLEFTEIEVQE